MSLALPISPAQALGIAPRDPAPLYEYFAKLTNAPYKRYVQIGEGTHSVTCHHPGREFD